MSSSMGLSGVAAYAETNVTTIASRAKRKIWTAFLTYDSSCFYMIYVIYV